jgi:hypothetical protein
MDILVLGAEKQAATSLASAYPEHRFRFVSDHSIIDGWDLANVTMSFAAPSQAMALADAAERVIVLCPRWLAPAAADRAALPSSFGRLAGVIPDRLLPVEARLSNGGEWIVKGARWHRPDTPIVGDAALFGDVTDPHGCGLVYQRHQPGVTRSILIVGRRGASGSTALGVIDVRGEMLEREAFLVAGETIDAPDIVADTLRALDALDHRGFFAFSWVVVNRKPLLTSFRPVPRAVFGSFRRAGVDLLAESTPQRVVPAGICFVGMPTYAGFRRQDA